MLYEIISTLFWYSWSSADTNLAAIYMEYEE